MIPESSQQTRPVTESHPCTATHPAQVLQVAVAVPLRRCFDYLSIAGAPAPTPGCRVLVPFGNRRLPGMVLATGTEPSVDRGRIKAVLACPDETPVLDQASLALLQWTASYYHHPIGEVIHTALPPELRQSGRAMAVERAWYLTQRGKAANETNLARAPRQWQALLTIRQRDGAPHRDLLDAGIPGRALSELARKGLIEARDLPRQPPVIRPEDATEVIPLALTAAQQEACSRLAGASASYNCWLLEGVTGSGKTEVYLNRIAECLAQGRQALMLVPEISLTPQTLERLARRLGGRHVLALHSGLSNSARTAAWQAAARGTPMVVIGTRSAVFIPLPELGLVVVDEEHDTSFKQQDGLRYSARDLAVWRASQADVPVILGSATPSLESIHNVNTGRYQHLVLSQRPGAGQLPILTIEDIRGQQLVAGMGTRLRARLRAHLDRGAQALLFLNRRGYAPVLFCSSCESTVGCPACDVNLTIHLGARQLRCHHCGLARPIPDTCPDCGEPDLAAVGAGTQRIEQEISSLFPQIPVIRVDRDSAQGAEDHAAIRAQLAQPGPAILIGTQLLAKGHHFPDITLVGILDIDQGLLSADFRATERTGQLLSQVAGRAGRGVGKGEVIVQTRNPDSAVLKDLARDGYGPFARELLRERAAAGLPPYSNLAKLSAEARQPDAALQFLDGVARALGSALGATGSEIWGPVPSPMQRRAGYYRAQLIFHNPSRKALHQLLGTLTGILEQRRIDRWNLDIDPVDLY